jgi:hypothetical protein
MDAWRSERFEDPGLIESADARLPRPVLVRSPDRPDASVRFRFSILSRARRYDAAQDRGICVVDMFTT